MTVWSAQGGAAQFIGRAEAKMVFGAVPQRKVEAWMPKLYENLL